MPKVLLPITLLHSREHAIRRRAGEANALGCMCLLKAPPDFSFALPFLLPAYSNPGLPEREYECERGICGDSFRHNIGVPAAPPRSVLLHAGRGPRVPLRHSAVDSLALSPSMQLTGGSLRHFPLPCLCCVGHGAGRTPWLCWVGPCTGAECVALKSFVPQIFPPSDFA